MSIPEPPPVIGDDKDWSWTTSRVCGECGFDPGSVTDAGLGAALRAASARWRPVLVAPGARERPRPQTWSPLEYACHVRDVHDVFAGRVALMLDRDDPRFANWDQDAAAVAGQYFRADPETVAAEVERAGHDAAERYESVPPGAWARTGRRGDGRSFTIAGLGRYHLHDVTHHLHDVNG